MASHAQTQHLRAAQQAAIFSMLNLNVQTAAEADPIIAVNTNASNSSVLQPSAVHGVAASSDPIWKVLIYDRLGQDVISPLLHVGDLRERGVTLHMSIYNDRQPIPDVPAIYFVEPTQENIRRIAEDLSRRLYDSYYINFSSTLSRPLLEDLAAAAVSSESTSLISQVYDQYLNYVTLEPNLFSLQISDAYVTLNNPSTTETEIDVLTNRIASSLFSVLVTLRTVPVIRCPRGTSAEAVAVKLKNMLRDHMLNARTSFFDEGVQLSRPVLVILDRDIDPSVLLSHTWTYSTLVHDILDMKLNRVFVNVDERGNSVRKSYDLDVSDFFWSKNAGNPFPQVAEDVDLEINKYKTESEQLTKSFGVSSLEEVDPNDFGSSAKNLSQAVKQLPELTLRKKTLDMHMNIATALFKAIQERQLDVFFSMEESISKITKSAMLEALRDPKKQPDDKMRLFLVFYLSLENVSKEDLNEYETELAKQGCNTSPVNFLKKIRMISKMATAVSNAPVASQPGGNDLFGTFTSNFSKLTDTLQSSGVSGHFQTLMSGVQNLLPTRREFAVTRIVDAIMEGTAGGSPVDDFLYLDPRSNVPGNASNQAPKGRVTFQEAIVFVVGGGNYLEHQNLMEYSQRANIVRKKITYGSTEMLTSKAFLDQLSVLGVN